MGQGSVSKQKLADSEYQFICNKVNDFYGEFSLYKNRANGKLVALINKVDRNSESIKTRINYDHENLLKIYKHQSNKVSDMCSENSYQQFLVEYFPNNIINHKVSENDLYKIIFSINDAMIYCQEQGNEINDLHPSKVLIDDSGTIKIIDNELVQQPLNNFQQVKYSDRTLEYLAPEQLQLFTKQKTQYSQEKANIFCLGLIVVHLITQTEISDYYLEEEINFDLMYKKVYQQFQRNQYSDNLNDLIQIMLQKQPTQRPSYKQLQARKLQIATFDRPPESLTISIQNMQGPDQVLQQGPVELQNSMNMPQQMTLQMPQQIDESLKQRIERAIQQSTKVLEQTEKYQYKSQHQKYTSSETQSDLFKFETIPNPLMPTQQQFNEDRIKNILQKSNEVMTRSRKRF
ncbi:hypothetical protein pb186bvf_017659 [Paramecium bursaria]